MTDSATTKKERISGQNDIRGQSSSSPSPPNPHALDDTRRNKISTGGTAPPRFREVVKSLFFFNYFPALFMRPCVLGARE